MVVAKYVDEPVSQGLNTWLNEFHTLKTVRET